MSFDKRCNYGVLKGFGKTPFWRDKLTSLVIDWKTMPTHLLTKNVSQAFLSTYLGALFLNVFLILFILAIKMFHPHRI